LSYEILNENYFVWKYALSWLYILLKWRNGTSIKDKIVTIWALWIHLNHGYGKEVHVLTGAVTLLSRATAIEVVVFVFGSVGSLVGTLSRHYPVHQLALQFVFGSVWVLGWYLGWALSGSPGCVCGPTVWGLRASEFSRMSGHLVGTLSGLYLVYQAVFVTPVLWTFFVWVMGSFPLN